MKIGDLAKKAGCRTVTVRYYEKEGLLEKPERTHSNYRMYTKEDLERLEFILHCRKHGIGLEAVHKLLIFRNDPSTDCTAIGTLLDTQIHSIEQQIVSLLQLKDGLVRLRSKCSGGHSSCGCTIIKNLEDKQHCCI